MPTRFTLLHIGLVAALGLALSGCTPKRGYRSYKGPEQSAAESEAERGRGQTTSIREIRNNDEVYRAEVQQNSIERHKGTFSLAFIEFNDKGELVERAQLERATELIRTEAGGVLGPGALVVVFVHGWKHNASVCDENVVCFREMLTGLYNLERLQAAKLGYKDPRRVVGIYLGWRGLSVTPRFLKEFTFFTRKATAHRIGENGAREVFQQLDEAVDSNSRLIIVGHSFGGALTFSAVKPLFEKQLQTAAPGAPIDGVGDLVVLVNPAFEARRYAEFDEWSREHADTGQLPALVTVTSDSDGATRKHFKSGRRLATLLALGWSKETKERARTAVGHYPEFRTHVLKLKTPEEPGGEGMSDIKELQPGDRGGKGDCVCSYIQHDLWSEEKIEIESRKKNPVESPVVLTDAESSADAPLTPFSMVYTEDRELPEEKRIIQKHNGIYNPIFVNFLRSAMFSIEQQRVDRVPTEELLETLAAQRSELGNDHPGTLKTMSFLADRYRAEGRYEEAESLQLEALTTQRDVLGDDHQDTLHTMSFLADLYKEQHRYEQAGRLYLEIYNSRDASAMDEDWNVAVSLYNLACFEAVRGNRKDAMDWLRRAVKERSSIVDLMIEDPELDSLHGPEFDALANSARGN